MDIVIESDNRDMSYTPKLSLIIPVYNTKEYVVKTLDSLKGLSSNDYELIIINDGSTDDSLKVVSDWLATWQGKYLLVSQENSGLSEARNTAIQYSRGTYLGFCDSDDWLDKYTISNALTVAMQSASDIVFFRSVVYNSVTKECHRFYDAGHWDGLLHGNFSKVTDINESPEILSFEPNTNNRIIRRDFFNEAIGGFPVGLHYEDVKPHVISLIQAQKIALVNSVGYYYRVNREGKITDQKSEKRFDIIKSIDEILKSEWLSKLHDYQLSCVMRGLIRILYWCGCNTLNKDRSQFFIQACDLFSNKNMQSRLYLKRALKYIESKKEFSLMLFLYNKSVSFLVGYSTGEDTLRNKLLFVLGLFTPDLKIMNMLTKKITLYSKYKIVSRIRES